MRYLGLDVHVKATVWCLLDASGQVVERGKVATTGPELQALLKRLSESEPVLVGQEVGKMTHLVHDALSALGSRPCTIPATPPPPARVPRLDAELVVRDVGAAVALVLAALE